MSLQNLASLDEVLSSYRPRIGSFIRGMVGDVAEVDDLVQETLIKVSKGWESYGGRSQLSSWIFQIAFNLTADFFRKNYAQKRTVTDEGSRAIHSKVTTPEQQVVKEEMSDCVRSFMERLSPSYLELLIKIDLDGAKVKEIAIEKSVSESVIKTRLHRARKKLKEILSEGCDLSRDGQDSIQCDRK